VAVLGKERIRGVLPGSESGSIDDAPKTATAINQRVFQRGHLLVEPDLVFIHAFATNKATLVHGFLGFAHVASWPTDATSLDAIPPNLRQHWTAPVKEYRRFNNLFGAEVFLILIYFFDLFSFLRGLLTSGRGWSLLLSKGNPLTKRNAADEQESKRNCGGFK